jgi:hypothetical protein
MHAMIEPLVAAVFIIAPFVLGFDSDNAKWMSVGIGAAVLLSGMTTRWDLSLVKLISLRAHYALDVVVALVALIIPWVMGFSGETTAVVFFLVMGVLELGAVYLTAWATENEYETFGSDHHTGLRTGGGIDSRVAPR